MDVRLPDGTIITNVPEGTTQSELMRRVGLMGAPQEQPVKDAGFSLGDIAKSFGIGAVGSTKALTDVAGAENVVSSKLGQGVESLQQSLTPERQAELQRQAARMKAAEESGSILQEIKAGALNVAEAPLQSAAQAIGSFVPYLPALFAAPAAAAIGLTGRSLSVITSVAQQAPKIIGTAQGAGAVKGSIYDGVLRAEIEAGVDPEVAKQKADAAQSYFGGNFDQIALGAGLGYVAGSKGVEELFSKAGRAGAAPGMARRVGESVLKESVPEGAQGGQEKVAENVALQRAGYDVDTFKGVAGAATQEALTGALGAAPIAAMVRPEVKPPEAVDAFEKEKEEFRKGFGKAEPVAPTAEAPTEPAPEPVEPPTEFPGGYTATRREISRQEVPESFGIFAEGSEKPLTTVASQEEVDRKLQSLTEIRQEEQARLLQESDKITKSIQDEQRKLEVMEATGQTDTDQYVQAKALLSQKEEEATLKLQDINDKIASYSAPLSFAPIGSRTDVQNEFIVNRGAEPIGVFPTLEQAEATLREREPEVFKQAEVAARTQELEKTLKPMLAKFNLGDVGLNIVEQIKNNAGGSYLDKLIQVSLEEAKPIQTMRHESLHALKDLQFFTPQQWNVLTEQANKKWIKEYLEGQTAEIEVDGKPVTMSRLDAYKKLGLTQEEIVEEAIADAFGAYDRGATPPPGMIAALFKKLKNFFMNFGQALRGAGFESADDVFQRVERGELKSRKPKEKAAAKSEPKAKPEEEAKEKLSLAPKGIPQKIWDLHEKSQEADEKARYYNVGPLKATATKASNRLVRAVAEMFPNDDQAQLALMVKMNEETSRREREAEEKADEVIYAKQKYSLAGEGVPMSTRNLMEQQTPVAQQNLGLNTEAGRSGTNNVRDIAKALNQQTLDQLGAMKRNKLTQDESTRISEAIADEVAYQLQTTSKTGTGLGWYSNNYPNAVKRLGKRFPELSTNKYARSVFSALVAVTSNGERVTKNIDNAITLYAKLRKGQPLVAMGNRRATALENNLQVIQDLMDKHGPDFEKVLLKEITVADMNAQLRKMGKKTDGSYLANTVVPAAAVYFGPKLGAFYANLSGSEGYLTMDLWWTRSINRMRGLLIPKATSASITKFRDMMERPDATRDEVIAATIPLRNKYEEYGWNSELEHLVGAKEPSTKAAKPAWFAQAEEKAGDAYEQLLFEHNLEKMANTIYKNEFEMLQEAPFTATDRKFMYDAARKAQTLLKNDGVDLSLADIQAALWYYEKRLYAKLSGRKADDIGYEEAIIAQANQGSGRARPSVVFDQRVDRGDDTQGEVSDSEAVRGQPSGSKERLKGKSDEDTRPEQPAVRPGPRSDEKRKGGEKYSLNAGLRAYRAGDDAPQTHTRRSGGDVGRIRVLGAKPIAQYIPADLFKEVVGQYGHQSPNLYEISGKDADVFESAIQASKNASRFGASVYVYPVEDYAKMRLFLTEDGKSGFALKDDDIVSVFSGPPHKGSVHSSIQLAVQEGGRRLDAFDTVLGDIYNTNGFQVVGRMKWNEDYKPDNWDKKTFAQFNGGEPDVVYMSYDPDDNRTISENPGKYFDDPDELAQAQREAVETYFNEGTGYGTAKQVEASKKSKSGIVLGDKQPYAISVYGSHYGNAQVSELDASKYGTGIRGAERRRLERTDDERIKRRVYFYIAKTDGSTPTPESGVGQYVYTQKFDNILGQGPEMSRLFLEANGDSNNFESLIVDAGYDGYAIPEMGMMVVLDHDVPVNYVGLRSEVGVPKLSLRTYFPSAREAEDAAYAKAPPSTKEFKLFLGGSQIVEEGRAVPMFHGSQDIFTQFRENKPIFVSPSAEEAERYGSRRAEKGEGVNVYPLWVRAETPFDYANPEHVQQVMDKMAQNNTLKGKQPAFFNRGHWEDIEDKDVQSAIKSLGFDSFYVKESGERNLAVYDASQVKSITGNIGDFSRESKDMRFSLPTIPQQITDRINEATFKRQEKGFVERMVSAISPESAASFRQRYLNRYNQMSVYDKKRAEQMGGAALLADQSAESAALMSDLGAGIAASAMGMGDRNGGIPVLRNGITTIDTNTKGMIASLAPLAAYGDPVIYQRYQYWAMVKRGQRLNANGTLTGIDSADVAFAKALEQKHPEFVSVQKDLIAFNNGLVKYMVDTGVLSKERGHEYTKHADYIPFYRQMDSGDTTLGPNLFQSLSGVKPPKKLKGKDVAEAPLADFLETMVRNTQSAIQAGVKNYAAQRAIDVALQVKAPGMGVERLPVASTEPNVINVLEKGKIVSYRTPDNLLIDAMKSLNLSELPFMGILSAPADLLRNLVTKDPGFMMANLMRDSLSAWVTSGQKMTPIAGTVINFGKALTRNSPGFEAMQNAGIIGGYEFSSNVEQSGFKLEKDLARKAGKRTDAVLLRPFKSLWDALETGTTASDAATRALIYERVLADTGNEAEALYRSLEVMNFHRKGNSALIRVLTAAVPFFNARLQGLDLFYRASTGNMNNKDAASIQRQFFARGMTMMALSTAYWFMVSDEEEYKKQEQETRDNNWIIPSLGIRIPIPFEVGVLFKVIPERIVAYTFGDDTGQDLRDSLFRNAMSTFAFNPIPQTAKPIIEASFNFNTFTWRPIVSKGMEDVAPEFQVGPSTSNVAKQLGQALGLSPMKVDHIIKGYTGTIGMYGIDTIDMVLDQFGDSPKPTKRFEQLPVIKRFAVDAEARGYVTQYYQLKDAVDTTVRTMNLLEKTGESEEYVKYLTKNQGTLAFKDYIRDTEKTMKELREARVAIRSSQMTGDEKRDALLEISKAESAITSQIQSIKKTIASIQ